MNRRAAVHAIIFISWAVRGEAVHGTLRGTIRAPSHHRRQSLLQGAGSVHQPLEPEFFSDSKDQQLNVPPPERIISTNSSEDDFWIDLKMPRHEDPISYGLGNDGLRDEFFALADSDEEWFQSLKPLANGSFEEQDPSSLLGITLWTRRSMNASTALACAEPGCEASVLVDAFSDATERARNCKLTLHVHATDFDDLHSGERVELIKVNGATISQDCFPVADLNSCMSDGNQTEPPMFSCRSEHTLDSLLMENGTATVSAKIPMEVDECPYKGNLLAAVPEITCLVTQKLNKTVSLPPPPPKPLLRANKSSVIYFEEPLKCLSRNCTARTNITLKERTMPYLSMSKCLLGLKLFQTDFDQDEDTSEIVEFIKVAGDVKKTNVTPGMNPCKSGASGVNGTSLAEARSVYMALNDIDVTKILDEQGEVSVEAKISPHVDECAYEGYLLSGVVSINCSVLLSGATEESLSLLNESV
jgi:hypothetical protein